MFDVYAVTANALSQQEMITVIALGLLLGLISPAPIIVKFHKAFVKDTAGGDYSALSILRTYGLVPGAVTALFDFAKVELAMGLALLYFESNVTAMIVAGCATVCGHLLPWYLRRKGDTGLFPYLGLSLMTLQFSGLWLLIAAAFLSGSVNCVALFIITFAVATPVFAAFCGFNSMCVTALAFASLAVLVAHLPAMSRVLKKREPTYLDIISQLYNTITTGPKHKK